MGAQGRTECLPTTLLGHTVKAGSLQVAIHLQLSVVLCYKPESERLIRADPGGS